MAVKVINKKVDPEGEGYLVGEYDLSAEEAVVQAWRDHSGKEGDPPDVTSSEGAVYCGEFGVLPDPTVLRPSPRRPAKSPRPE